VIATIEAMRRTRKWSAARICFELNAQGVSISRRTVSRLLGVKWSQVQILSARHCEPDHCQPDQRTSRSATFRRAATKRKAVPHRGR
jgi:hypothetical protein